MNNMNNMNNMNPDIWGKHAWFFLHSITLAYPKYPTCTDREMYKNFFLNLQYVLPCLACKSNFKEHLKKLPLNDNVLSSRVSLTQWLSNMHNEINKSLNKPEKFNIKSILDTYNGKKDNKYDRTIIIILLIVIVIIIMLVITRNSAFLNAIK